MNNITLMPIDWFVVKNYTDIFKQTHYKAFRIMYIEVTKTKETYYQVNGKSIPYKLNDDEFICYISELPINTIIAKPLKQSKPNEYGLEHYS